MQHDATPLTVEVSAPPVRTAEKLAVTVSMPSMTTAEPLLTDSCAYCVATTLTEKSVALALPLALAPTPTVAAPEVKDMDLTEKQATAEQALAELFEVQQITDDEELMKKLMKEFDADDEAERKQQLAKMARNWPLTSAASETDLIPDDQLPVERLRYDQIEEMLYLQLMDHAKRETEAVAQGK